MGRLIQLNKLFNIIKIFTLQRYAEIKQGSDELLNKEIMFQRIPQY